MRELLSKLKETLGDVMLYDNPTSLALKELEAKIIEVEKRIECAISCNGEMKQIVDKFANAFHNEKQVFQILKYGQFEQIERGTNDVAIVLDLNDTEAIENDWNGLFKEEVRVLIPKDTLVEWKAKIPTYSAEGGATAKVIKDYTTNCDFLHVEFLDKKANGQENGGYAEIQFNVIATPNGLSEPKESDSNYFKVTSHTYKHLEGKIFKVINSTKNDVGDMVGELHNCPHPEDETVNLCVNLDLDGEFVNSLSEPKEEVSHSGIPYRVCKHCAIKEEEIVMHKVGEDWECNDCQASSEITKLKTIHEKIRQVLINNGCEEFGDNIVDEICNVVGILPTTVYYEE